MDASGDPVVQQPTPPIKKAAEDLLASATELIKVLEKQNSRHLQEKARMKAEITRLNTELLTAQTAAAFWEGGCNEIKKLFEEEKKKAVATTRTLVEGTYIVPPVDTNPCHCINPFSTASLLGPNPVAPVPTPVFPSFNSAPLLFGGNVPAPALPNLVPNFNPLPHLLPAPMVYGIPGPSAPPLIIPQINSLYPTPIVFGNPGPIGPLSISQ